MKKLSHIDDAGKAKMVDVSGKAHSLRVAVARGAVHMSEATLRRIRENSIAKGDVLGIARVAGIMAAKKTSEIIPLCHSLSVSSVDVLFSEEPDRGRILIEACVKITGQTGVEMEALTAVSAAALTIYDMCKAVDKEMIISEIMLIKKSGGRSGTFERSSADQKI